jgi:hypothetical protein
MGQEKSLKKDNKKKDNKISSSLFLFQAQSKTIF